MNTKPSQSHQGFAHIIAIVLIVGIVAALGIAAFMAFQKHQKQTASAQSSASSSSAQASSSAAIAASIDQEMKDESAIDASQGAQYEGVSNDVSNSATTLGSSYDESNF